MTHARITRRRLLAVATATSAALASACGQAATTPVASGPKQPLGGKVSWLTSGDEPTRQFYEKTIAGYRVNGQQLFFPDAKAGS